MRLLLTTLTGFLILLMVSQVRNVVSITFDDGLLSQYEASKLLEQYGYKATFYIPSGLIGKEFEGNEIMNYSQIINLYIKGNEIGCHGLNHTNMSALSDEEFEKELSECKEELGELNITSFAYPYGYGTERESIVRKYYSSARVPIQELNKEIGFNVKALILVHDRMERLNTLRSWLKQDGWIVITIHGVTENPRGLIDITPEELKEVLDIIKESGAEVKTIKEVTTIEN